MIILLLILIAIVAFACWFYRHQQLLKDRAHLMREAIHNRDFTFHLPVKGLFFGERALQEALNDMGKNVRTLVAQKEVESWQRLTRVLTHEIMNATAPISSISQAYLNNPQIKGTIYEEGIRAIFETAGGLSNFVDSYRKFTSLQEPELNPVHLLSFFQNIKTLYPQMEWHIDLPADIQITADENMLRQVMINLVKNAIEAKAKEMDVRWKEGLFISNNGAPIPADVAREIFIPFFTTKQSGCGIGLSLSRQMMLKQGIELKLAETPISGYPVTFLFSFDN
jgi:nitrogen fixation/metabolism regulation signal transduction histidine kinase